MLLFVSMRLVGLTSFAFFHYNCFISGSAHPQNPPILYEISKDDTERNAIDPTSKEYKEVRAIIELRLAAHEHSMDANIPSQFDWKNQLWRPWLQPCCGGPFPFCGCRDEQDVAAITSDAQ